VLFYTNWFRMLWKASASAVLAAIDCLTEAS
jgi:hypothetical protein